MTKAQKKARISEIRQTLEFLHWCSEMQHGVSFVRFSPCYRDPYSKRRVRLVREYHALRKSLQA